jgi:branched-chain amino acid transport system ATP-binding protein
MSLVKLVDVTISFGSLVANDRVSFNVEENTIVGLIGPNGAGKTTLFNCISGFLKPSAGSVVFKGQDITGWPTYEIARLGLVRTFQIVKPFAEMTVLENVMVGAYLRAEDSKGAREIAMNCLELCKLRALESRPAGDLPIGQKKRLEMARALATKPSFLMLDESVAGLTSTEVKETVEVIRNVKEKGKVTILMVEHIMEAVMSLADHLVVLDGGLKIAEGAPCEVVKKPEVITAYLGAKFSKRLQEKQG